MRPWIFTLIVYFFVPLAIGNHCCYSQHHNRYNRHKERTGKWIVYADSAKKIKSTVVRYRNGNAVGRGYYYTSEGYLGRKEIVRFNRIRTSFYYPNGIKRLKGKARIESRGDTLHYFFYGRWKYYDEKGKLVKYNYYKKGGLVNTVYLDKNNRLIDSLINVLNTLEKNFKEKNRELLNAIDKCWYDHRKSENYRLQLFRQDSLTFSETGKFLERSGYPSVKLTGESSGVPFFIMCYATTDLKEKYLPFFRKAVVTGDLASTTLAFYIDKLELAKGEKQVYGTQYYFDKNRKTVFYPSVDPENLEKRRQAVGL